MSEVAEQSQTAGRLLREARESAGLHIAALAVALKVPVNKLEALEADNYGALLDTVFARALAGSVCRTLKIDPAPIMSLLPQSVSPALAPKGAGLNAPLKGSAVKSISSSTASSRAGVSRSVGIAVVVLLAGVVALIFWPKSQGVSPLSLASPTQVVQETALSAPASAAALSPAVAASVDVPPDAAALTVPVVAPTAVVAALPAAPVMAPAAGASAAVAEASVSQDVLVLQARGESWVQIRGGSGTVVLQRNVKAGETVNLSGPLPLSVVIGRADVTSATVRGKSFDLTAVARENVARFEVK